MTTDPTPDLCCTHGQQLDTLATELARANQLLADLVEIRRGKNSQHRPTPDEVVAFARGGIVKAPEGSEPVTYDPECDGLVITAEQVRRMGITTLDELRGRLLDGQPLVGNDGRVSGDSIPVHISPGESMLPGPGGPIHVRGAYGDEPAQVAEIDIDDLDDERD